MIMSIVVLLLQVIGCLNQIALRLDHSPLHISVESLVCPHGPTELLFYSSAIMCLCLKLPFTRQFVFVVTFTCHHTEPDVVLRDKSKLKSHCIESGMEEEETSCLCCRPKFKRLPIKKKTQGCTLESISQFCKVSFLIPCSFVRMPKRDP